MLVFLDVVKPFLRENQVDRIVLQGLELENLYMTLVSVTFAASRSDAMLILPPP